MLCERVTELLILRLSALVSYFDYEVVKHDPFKYVRVA